MNTSALRYAKAGVAILGLIAQVAAALVADTNHSQDISQIVIAVLTALGVYGVRNAPPAAPPADPPPSTIPNTPPWVS